MLLCLENIYPHIKSEQVLRMADHYYTENPHSKMNKNKWTYDFEGKTFRFISSTGVFSKERIDFGSRTLIDAFELPQVSGGVLDLGCGYGPIGLLLASKFSERHFTMVDVNERAIELAKENARNNEVDNVTILKSDGLQNVNHEKYAAILTNPPIRRGKKVIYELFKQSKSALEEDGELWVVIQKKQGAPSAIKFLETLFNRVEVVQKKKGYYIIVAK